MFKRLMFLFATVFCLSTVSQVFGEVLDGPRGPVEFIGLEKWTASDLFDAIQEVDPDRPFRACAAVMKRDLEFPDAAAFGFVKNLEDGSRELYTVVVGVEDSSSVKYRKAGNDTLDLPESWQKLLVGVEDEYYTYSAAAYVRLLLSIPETAKQLAELPEVEATETSYEFAEMFGATAEVFDMVSSFFNEIDKDSDYSLALEVLVKDERWSARFVATLVLSHFPRDHESWYGLIDSLIDPAQQVRDVGTKLVEGLVRAEKAVSIPWSEARGTLVALFGGTYPFAFNKVLNALVATEIDPTLGRELVKEQPRLLLAFAGAEHEKTRTPAQVFLKTISGEETEQSVDAWKAWLGETNQETLD